MSQRSVEQLREEIAVLDGDLARLTEQERAADRGIDELALQARRGDEVAERRIHEHENSHSAALNNRRRLQAARASIEAEIQMAVAAAEREVLKERAREAQTILAIFRKRGAAIETELRKVLADYAGIQSDMTTLANLGMTRVNPELVKANCARAFRAALISIRTDLELNLVPPLERRGFADLVGAWAGSAERLIRAILSEPEDVSAPTPPTGAVEQIQAGA